MIDAFNAFPKFYRAREPAFQGKKKKLVDRQKP